MKASASSMLWVVAALFGCNQQSLPIAARLGGAHDMVRSGEVIFVTSSDRDELRALDLTIGKDLTTRDFVRAPNPLEALSIPVIDFPVALARDQDPGLRDVNASRYVYARSEGSPAISIVLAEDRADLREARRFFAEAPVSAIAGRAPAGGASSADPSVLYYATWNGSRSVLWRLEVPPPAQLTQAEAPPPLVPERITSIEGTAVKSLLVLPAESELAVSIATPTVSEPWFGWVLDTDTLARRQLQFPSPVKRMYTNPGRSGDDELPGLLPGAWIYALLDDYSCQGAAAAGLVRSCPGIFVVDAASGAEVLDADGKKMVLDLGGGVPMGLSIQPNAPLRGVDGSQANTALLGIVTTSGGAPEPAGGQIHFFHAQRLRGFNMSSSEPSATAVFLNAAGSTLSYVDGPIPSTLSVTRGQTRDDTVQIVYRGLIPGLTDLPRDPGVSTFNLPFPERLASGAVAILQLNGEPCGAPIPFAVDPDPNAPAPTNPVTFAVPVAPECDGATSFSVRAVGARPYVVGGLVAGYMGRTGPNHTFEFDARVFFELENSALPAPANRHYLSFVFGAGAAEGAIAQDDRYLIALTSGYLSYTFWPDPVAFTGYYLPTAVVNYVSEVPPEDRDEKDIPAAFVAYPSAPGIMEINTVLAVPGVGSRGPTFIEHR